MYILCQKNAYLVSFLPLNLPPH
ncbi:hypothetical protein E2C01_069642 [Portunus trituberculatus]|uniref:Uncharacterized protein n=1 Tax=Portunus trituberculatus TaxID=210409 RepID=A0A5B7I2V9_PORTR|nr:hypothetical protein [Portunus trituberculatus]